MVDKERAQAGRLGGYARAAKYGGAAATAGMRKAFLQTFLDAVPADLPERERRQRARSALRLHMGRLKLKADKKRARAKAAKKASAQASRRRATTTPI